MTPCRSLSTNKPTTSWIWVSNPTSGDSSEARSAKPVRVGAYTAWEAASKRGMTFCQHHPPCTSTNVAMLASYGSVPRKTYTMKCLPPVPLSLRRPLLRGYIDAEATCRYEHNMAPHLESL